MDTKTPWWVCLALPFVVSIGCGSDESDDVNGAPAGGGTSSGGAAQGGTASGGTSGSSGASSGGSSGGTAGGGGNVGGAGGSEIPELPPGYALLFQHDGSRLTPADWGLADGAGDVAIATDPAAPFSPAGVIEFTYPAGFVSGNEPAKLYRSPGASTRLFITYWFKYNEAFVGEQSGVNKHLFLFGGGSTGVILYTESRFTGNASTFHPDVQFQDASDVPNNNQRLAADFGSIIDVDKTEWHRHSIEIDKAAASVKGWIDGSLYGTVTGLDCADFGEFQIAPTWGGNTGQQVAVAQQLFVDEVRVYSY